jgi:uncharacterized protein YcaQ
MKPALSLAEARRIALVAQGFSGQSRDVKPTWRKLAKAIDELHLLQIDSVNVLVRSHYMPLFSRLGNYARGTLDERSLAQTNRHMFECWAHEASLVPLSLHPLMRWRMERARNHDGIYRHFDNFGRQEKTFLKNTLAFIAKNGPTTASVIPGAGKSAGGWWGWSKGKLALETLFDQGHVTTSHRDGFERIYDLTERVIPAEILALPTPKEGESFRSLMLLSAKALGLGTEIDLRDYFRLPVAEARTALQALVGDGQLIETKVETWAKPAYLLPGTRIPKKAGGTALLTPFDPLVWNRDRAERLFNFHYRIELYTPEHKRKFGYYVLPFLYGEDLAARFCLKADRENGVLRVNTAHHEERHATPELATAAAAELHRMADWLGLQDLQVAKKGNLAGALAKQM